MDPFSIMMVAIALGSTIGKFVGQSQEEANTQNELNQKAQLYNLQYSQKVLKGYDIQKNIMDTQIAQASARGYKLSSASFGAIAGNTTNTAARLAANDAAEYSLKQQNINTERQNAQDHLTTQIFGDVTDAVKQTYQLNQDSAKSG